MDKQTKESDFICGVNCGCKTANHCKSPVLYYVNCDEVIILEVLQSTVGIYYDKRDIYPSFKDAKQAIIDYQKRGLHTMRLNLKAAKKLTIKSTR